jgi:hypothetical protein
MSRFSWLVGQVQSHDGCVTENGDMEFDIKTAQFTLLSQIVDRVGLVLEHPVAQFQQLRRYAVERESINPTLHQSPVEAKRIAIAILNGMHIPASLEGDEFALGLKKESRLLRWLASSLDPTFHTFLLEGVKKDWPEAAALFYLWTPAEDYILESMCTYTATLSPHHLSLHYDAIKVDSSCVTGDTSEFSMALEQEIFTHTGYTVTIATKPQMLLLELVKMPRHTRRQLEFPEVAGRHGNCIPACLLYLGFQAEAVLKELKRNIAANRQALSCGYRSYRSCASQFNCVLCPVDLSDIAPGSYILHVASVSPRVHTIHD